MFIDSTEIKINLCMVVQEACWHCHPEQLSQSSERPISHAFLCFAFIVQHGRFHVSGCHQSLYSLWTIRDSVHVADSGAAMRIKSSILYLSGILDEKGLWDSEKSSEEKHSKEKAVGDEEATSILSETVEVRWDRMEEDCQAPWLGSSWMVISRAVYNVWTLATSTLLVWSKRIDHGTFTKRWVLTDRTLRSTEITIRTYSGKLRLYQMENLLNVD